MLSGDYSKGFIKKVELAPNKSELNPWSVLENDEGRGGGMGHLSSSELDPPPTLLSKERNKKIPLLPFLSGEMTMYIIVVLWHILRVMLSKWWLVRCIFICVASMQ